MAKIAFILLCHKDPEAIIKQAQSLTAAGDYIAIHFDARAGRAGYAQIREALSDNPNVVFAKKRVRCGWGAWSLVKATLGTVETAAEAFPRATHFYMVSGDCMAIKSAEYAHAYLDEHNVDYIENHDFFRTDWIKTGWRDERLIYRHWFNERTQRRRFYAMFQVQKHLGLKRRIPADLEVRIGSQWWCLRRRTIEKILSFVATRRDVVRFFATTWVPDETFFQTLVPHLIPADQIKGRTQTFLMFSDYGMPVTFYNDHYDMLMSQDYLFARKISPDAIDLERRLGVLYASRGTRFEISNEGPALYTFLVGQGRAGRRFAPRFWEKEASLGRERELLIVVSKKWHVAKRLLGQIRQQTNVPCIEYLFNEEDTDLPDMGGIQRTMAKRQRHRRALMRMLFDYYETDRLLFCIDPGNLDLIEDFCADRAVTRLLEVEATYTEEFLIGHAQRVGLAGEHTALDTMKRLIPSVRNDIAHESDRLRDKEFANYTCIREVDPPETNARQIAKFLSLPDEKAAEIARTPNLFAD